MTTIHLTPRRTLLASVLPQRGQYRSTHQRVEHPQRDNRAQHVDAQHDQENGNKPGNTIEIHTSMVAKVAFVASGSVLALALAALSLAVYR